MFALLLDVDIEPLSTAKSNNKYKKKRNHSHNYRGRILSAVRRIFATLRWENTQSQHWDFKSVVYSLCDCFLHKHKKEAKLNVEKKQNS